MRDNDGEERRSELLQKIADHLYVTLDCNRKESRYPLWSNSENDSADNCNAIIIVVEPSLVTYLLTIQRHTSSYPFPPVDNSNNE